jgi:mono/diheme cytochrome c family protein
MKKIALWIILGVAILFLVAQLIPYGRDHTNPAVQQEPQWDTPQTRELAKRACFNCHSNETVWPWYSNIAPVSWLVYRDAMEGRSRVNFSEWNRGEQEVEDAAELVQNGEMPLPIYLLMHPEARLSAAEKQTLIQGLIATFGGSSGEGEEDD